MALSVVAGPRRTWLAPKTPAAPAVNRICSSTWCPRGPARAFSGARTSSRPEIGGGRRPDQRRHRPGERTSFPDPGAARRPAAGHGGRRRPRPSPDSRRRGPGQGDPCCRAGQEIAEAADTPDDQVFELAQAVAFEGQALGPPDPRQAGDPSRRQIPPGSQAWRGEIYPASDRIVVADLRAPSMKDELRLVWSPAAECGAAFADEPALEAPRMAEDAAFTGGRAREKRRLEQAHLVFMLLRLSRIADLRPTVLGFSPVRRDVGRRNVDRRAFPGGFWREKLGLAYAIGRLGRRLVRRAGCLASMPAAPPATPGLGWPRSLPAT